MMTLLRREGSIHAIDRKYADDTSNSNKEKIEGDALSVIQLSLAPNVLCEVSTIYWMKRDEEMLTCDLLFSLNSKYRDNENSMMYNKQPEQVRQALNSCDVWRHFEGDKDNEASRIFVRGRTNQKGRGKSK
ncbi:hypothetical protein KY284_000678 [Solanum tuberosum]|nr:hypothetical protein KY284_000678 [Solanum tuberosum]